MSGVPGGRRALRVVAAVLLVGLAAAWLALQGSGSAAATPLLVVALVLSVACALATLAGLL